MKLLFENWRKFLKEQVETEEQAAQWLAEKIAPLIEQADAGNYTEPLAELVKQLNTPDGMSPAVRNLLKMGADDGSPGDESIKVETGKSISAPQLTPTQGVIDLFKSVGFNGSNAAALQSVIDGTSGAPPILAAGSGGQYFIIDGHHRWSGATVYNVKCMIPANIIVMDPGKALLVSQLSIAAYLGSGSKLPSASAKKGRSIIGPEAMKSTAVQETLTNNIGKVMDPKAGGTFMNPEVVAVIESSGYGQAAPPMEEPVEPLAEQENPVSGQSEVIAAAIKKVADNCGILANKYSSAGPDREIMPQFDPDKGGPKFGAVKKDFEQGNLNYSPKFKLDLKKESKRKRKITYRRKKK